LGRRENLSADFTRGREIYHTGLNKGGKLGESSVYISQRKGKLTIQFYVIFHSGHGRFTIHDEFVFLNMYSKESKIYMNLTSIFLDSSEKVRKVCKDLEISPK